jgi:mevalonate kinase
MPAIFSHAPAKAILFGEHAVVYGQPAIAIPIHELRTKVTIHALPQAAHGYVKVISPAIDLEADITNLHSGNPIAKAVALILSHFGITAFPACQINIQSTIPVGCGLGSGAAVAVATLRALSSFLGHPLSDEDVNRYAFEVEKLHHKTPSGIDNTVITYGKPVFYEHGHDISFLNISRPFDLVIANSGAKVRTSETVLQVQKNHEIDPITYNAYFQSIGDFSRQARSMLENGETGNLGALMTENQSILSKMGLSTPRLDELIEIAVKNGATGAKLTGGGGGGFIIAMVNEQTKESVADAIISAGAINVHKIRLEKQL